MYKKVGNRPDQVSEEVHRGTLEKFDLGMLQHAEDQSLREGEHGGHKPGGDNHDSAAFPINIYNKKMY